MQINQNNEAYVENFIPNATEGEKRKLKSILDNYGDDKWWLSDDHELIARKQLMQPFLVVDMNTFKKSIEKVLGKGIRLSDFDAGESFENLKTRVFRRLSELEAERKNER